MVYDTTHHVRILPPVDGDSPRDLEGRYLPQLPAFERLEPDPNWRQMCACNARRGLHRWGDEACPDPSWRPGNGKKQFFETFTFDRRP